MKSIRTFLDEQTVEAAKSSPCIHEWKETWIHSWPQSECTGARCSHCSFRLTKFQWDLYNLEKSA